MRLILIGFHLYLLLVPAALSAQNVRLQALDYAVYIGGLRAIERARLDLADDDVLRAGCDLIHDVIAVTIGIARIGCGCGEVFVRARALPRPASLVPPVLADGAGGIDHWNAFGVAFINQLPDMGQGLPRILAAGGPPFLDRVEDRF